ncbi:MAG: hypothetical protein ACYDCN_01115, partial [Bacteroidia bacterium]
MIFQLFHIVKQLQSILSKGGSSLIFIIDGLNEVDKQKAFEINEECARLSFIPMLNDNKEKKQQVGEKFLSKVVNEKQSRRTLR